MLSRTFTHLAPVRVTVGYATALLVVASVLAVLGTPAQEAAVARLSTNLDNLAQGHLGTLLGSAFVNADGETYLLVPGLVCLLGLAEVLWRSRRLIAVFLLGHVGATLVVAAGLAVAVHQGWLPDSVTRASDVGLSYGAVAVLGTLTAAVPAQWRPAWVGGWLTVAAVVVVASADFTAAGHAIALLLGMVLSRRFDREAQWTVLRFALLAVAIAFGLLLFVGVSLSAAPVAVATATAVAVATRWATRRQFQMRTRRSGSRKSSSESLTSNAS